MFDCREVTEWHTTTQCRSTWMGNRKAVRHFGLNRWMGFYIRNICGYMCDVNIVVIFVIACDLSILERMYVCDSTSQVYILGWQNERCTNKCMSDLTRMSDSQVRRPTPEICESFPYSQVYSKPDRFHGATSCIR